MKQLRVIIAGSRSFSDYALMKSECQQFLAGYRDCEVTIISGGAAGADQLGELFARESGYQLRKFLPDWPRDGKKAGILRNIEMAHNADALIAFWDGCSRGTSHMIDTARKMGRVVKVVSYT